MTQRVLSLKAFAAALWFGVAVLAVTVLVLASNLLIPFAVALMVWFLINALAGSYRHIRIRGWTPPGWLRLGLAMAMILLAGYLIVLLVSANVEAVAERAPDYQRKINEVLRAVASWVGLREVLSIEDVVREIGVGDLLGGIAGTVGNIVTDAGIVLIYVLFLLVEQRAFDAKMNALFPDPGRQERVRTLLSRMAGEIQEYVRIMTLMSALVGALSYGVMAWVGLDYAGFWAFLLFLLNFIPSIGVLIGVAFPALLALVQFDTMRPFLIIVAVIVGGQTFIANVIQPRMAGRTLNLSPLIVIASLFAWGAMWGIPGMFLAIPIMVVLTIVLSYFPATRPVAIILSERGRIKD